MTQLRAWLDGALAAGTREPNAMALATADPSGAPSARVVLLRGLDDEGLTWYTNRTSLKGRDLAANPRAAVVFHWELLRRQVRVSGDVEDIPESESQGYFAARPRKSQLSAWASPQGQELADRAELEAATEAVDARFPEARAAAAVLGRLSSPARDVRVLAGTPRPHARPLPLPARG